MLAQARAGGSFKRRRVDPVTNTAFHSEDLARATRAETDARAAIGRARRIVDRSRELLTAQAIGAEPLPVAGRTAEDPLGPAGG
jgi:hypothetical protein